MSTKAELEARVAELEKMVWDILDSASRKESPWVLYSLLSGIKVKMLTKPPKVKRK